jgi:U3 small nucleolar RNA-associated protein 20
VRQEHLALMRRLAALLPCRFPALQLLLSDDPELDFFNNVAHLQSHRSGAVVLLLLLRLP